MKQYDIVIIVLPFLFAQPITGPFLLKSYLKENGFSCKILDWNNKLFNVHGFSSNSELTKLESKYTNNSIVTSYGKSQLQKLVPIWLEEIKKYNPKFIGISINNYNCNKSIDEYLIPPIRKIFPDTKIIVGGNAIFLDGLEYEKQLLEKYHIDYYVKGEGEEALLSILKNETWDNNTPLKRFKYVKNSPDPDYSDILEDLIENNNLKEHDRFKNFPIITSRGCNRKCNYCMYLLKNNIYTRSPENIVNEIYELNKLGIYSFRFVDALSNISTKHLISICDLIIEKKKNNELTDIKWSANMCCFPKRINDHIMYKKMKEAGCEFVNVGIESGSPQVRIDMDKKIEDKDIFYMFEQLTKNNITGIVHVLIGYYTETDKDFDMTINLIKKLVTLYKDNIIIDIGMTFQINNIKTWEHLGVIEDGTGSWYYKDNTYILRVRRWLKAYKLCKKLNVRYVAYYNRLIYNRLSKYDNINNLKYLKSLIKKVESKND
jgi:anaerobic magnesium-protoporphyrin IX monomethyl ester cyclase